MKTVNKDHSSTIKFQGAYLDRQAEENAFFNDTKNLGD